MIVRLYPADPSRALGRAVIDALALGWIFVWLMAGRALYGVIMALEVIADGITRTGNTFNGVIHDFRNHIPDNVPFVTSSLRDLADALQHNSGDPIVRSGAQIHDQIHQFALVLAVLISVPPVAFMLFTYGRRRLLSILEMTAAQRFITVGGAGTSPLAVDAVLAHRAIATLSFRELMRASQDPVGDLAAGEYRGLASAMRRQQGLPARATDKALEPRRATRSRE